MNEYSKYWSIRIMLVIGLLSTNIALGHNSVVVVPLLGDDARPLLNIVTVAKQNGQFSDIQSAIDSITNASSTRQYLIIIAPGQYIVTKSIQMKEYVSVTGSGAEAVKLIGKIGLPIGSFFDGAAAVIEMANHMTLSHLSVINTGDAGLSLGIYTDGLDETAKLQNLIVRSSGSGSSWAIISSGALQITDVVAIADLCNGDFPNFSGAIYSGQTANARFARVKATSNCTGVHYAIALVSSSVPLNNVDARATGGTDPRGIHTDISSSKMTNIYVSATGGTTSNVGMELFSYSGVIKDALVYASGSALRNYGINSGVASSTTLDGVHVEAEGSGNSYGIRVQTNMISNSTVRIRRSTLFGKINGINVIEGTNAHLSQSTIINGVSGAGSAHCVASDDGFDNALNASCL